MNDLFGNNLKELKNKKLYFLDMDGTIYLGNNLFKETIPFLQYIKEKGGRYLFLTNNSSKSVSTYIEKLNRLGITNVTEDDFYTSSMASSLLIKEKYPNAKVYVQGTKSFIAGLRKDGLDIVTDYEEDIDVVLVGFDSELTMEKLRTTSYILTVKKDIPYYATNPDWVCPTEWGYEPDCGSMCFGLEKATGRKPIFIGKPKRLMIDCAMKKAGYEKEDTIIVGDRLYTDIASGNNAGITTVCVLSGETTKEMALDSKGVERPSYLVDDISYLIV